MSDRAIQVQGISARVALPLAIVRYVRHTVEHFDRLQAWTKAWIETA
jgi:hypothetical protein